MYNCIVYKLCNAINSKIYVGSTKNQIGKRFSKHKWDAKKGSKIRVHVHMREIGIDKFYIEILEEKQVQTRQEQLKLETLWQVKLNSELNQRQAYTSEEQRKEREATYCRDNKELINERQKKYHIKNKESDNLRLRKYYRNHKELIKEQKKKYYNEHRQNILEKAKKKISCECGSIVRKYGLFKHKRSKKHLACLEQIKEELKDDALTNT